jgi:hypothetical protein
VHSDNYGRCSEMNTHGASTCWRMMNYMDKKHIPHDFWHVL